MITIVVRVTSLVVWNIFVVKKMAEEQERHVEAADSTEGEMDESYVGSNNTTDDIRNIMCDELGVTDSADEEPRAEPEHAAWVGRVPLSDTLSAWNVERERERLVIVGIIKHIYQ